VAVTSRAGRTARWVLHRQGLRPPGGGQRTSCDHREPPGHAARLGSAGRGRGML